MLYLLSDNLSGDDTDPNRRYVYTSDATIFVTSREMAFTMSCINVSQASGDKENKNHVGVNGPLQRSSNH